MAPYYCFDLFQFLVEICCHFLKYLWLVVVVETTGLLGSEEVGPNQVEVLVPRKMTQLTLQLRQHLETIDQPQDVPLVNLWVQVQDEVGVQSSSSLL